MGKQETSLQLLDRFLPAGSFELITPYFKRYTIHLTLTRERKSVLGDYRTPWRQNPEHRISININLNPYSFLITLLHELAHLLVFEHFGIKVKPHGREWKTQFRHVLLPFTGKGFFPKNVEKALSAYLHNPAASTCTDPALFKALYKHDEQKAGYFLVDDLEVGSWFETEDGRLFEKLEQLRTRCRCKDLGTERVYFFQGIIEVKQVRKDRRRIA